MKLQPDISFFREHSGREVDALVPSEGVMIFMKLNQVKLYVRITQRTLIGLQNVLTMPGGRS